MGRACRVFLLGRPGRERGRGEGREEVPESGSAGRGGGAEDEVVEHRLLLVFGRQLVEVGE